MLTTHPDPCWHLVDAKGREFDPHGDGTPHYTTRVEADAEASRRGDDSLTARQFAQPCVTVACSDDDCDAEPEDDVWGTIHFPDEETARDLADVYDFTIDPDGKAWCDDHKARDPQEVA